MGVFQIQRNSQHPADNQRRQRDTGEAGSFAAIERQRQYRHADRQHREPREVETSGLHGVVGHQH